MSWGAQSGSRSCRLTSSGSETEGSWPRPAVDMLLDAWAATMGRPAFVSSAVADILGSRADLPPVGHRSRRRAHGSSAGRRSLNRERQAPGRLSPVGTGGSRRGHRWAASRMRSCSTLTHPASTPEPSFAGRDDSAHAGRPPGRWTRPGGYGSLSPCQRPPSSVPALAARELLYGAWSVIPSPLSVRLLAVAGLDYVVIDLQHGGATEADLARHDQRDPAGGSGARRPRPACKHRRHRPGSRPGLRGRHRPPTSTRQNRPARWPARSVTRLRGTGPLAGCWLRRSRSASSWPSRLPP